MTVNSANARIFGSDADAIFLAPLGSTLPTTITATVDAAFEDVGWLHSDGVTESATGSKKVIRGHQGNNVVRTRIDEPGTTVAFVALEDKVQTRELRYDIQSHSTAAGVRSETRGAGQKVQVRAAVIDFYDADDETIKERWIISRLEIVADGDKVFVNSDISAYPFNGEIIGSYDVLTSGPVGAES